MSPIRLLFSADYRVFHVFSYPLFCISSDLLNVLLLAKDRMDGSQTLEIPTVEKEDEEWDEEDEDYDEEDDEIDAHAEEIARQLGEQLWAEINKAQADLAGAAPPAEDISSAQDTLPTEADNHIPEPAVHLSKKEEAAIITMKTILSIVENDSLARATLASTLVPDANGENVLDILTRTVASGNIRKEIAKSLSHILVVLARSDALFATLRLSNASSIQLDKGKRKREQNDDGWQTEMPPRSDKRQVIPHYDLHVQVTEAVRVINQALSENTSNFLDPSLIASIQLQLHQVFLFAVTSSAAGGPDMSSLQEISGLIQIVGVLSGIQIGPNADSSAISPPQVPASDIGTAVYPCLVAGCGKTFSRLYSLRAHQRVHAVERPFRCDSCPASFTRNHDLKRHSKLHGKKAWKCSGCAKLFSRRDAIKRHKSGGRGRTGKSEVPVACLEAEIQEVEVDAQAEEEMLREERRARMWTVGGAPVAGHSGYNNEDASLEEGEVQAGVISQVQSAVRSLHGSLQSCVTNYLESTSHTQGSDTTSTLDPARSQATLASVIAQAQLSLPLEVRNATSTPPAESSSITTAQSNSESLNPSGNLAEPTMSSLSRYGLSEEQAKMLEQAIASAASAAQAQAEAEAALEEQDEEGEYDEDDNLADEDTEEPAPALTVE